MRLLAIDDLADNLVSLSALLRTYLPGCEMETALSGEEGIAKARSFQPDTILLDIQMPGMDGFEVGGLPEVEGDAALLRQVWINLLSNAVKFSAGKEKPVIEVEGAVDGDRAVYRVRDNGAGFDMAYAGKLFGVFQRLHGMNEFEGTGVGLALVHRIVSRHGGRVWAEGAVGQGATFSFELPVRVAARAGENGVQSL